LIGAPATKHEVLSQVEVIVKAVDQRGRDIDTRWGIGRLPALVPHDVAERFRVQHRKFSGAIWEYDAEQARKHGDAMLRAYDKLEQLAIASGASPAPPEQWEFETPAGLVILVRDIRDTARVDRGGREAQVWSLDEIANVIAAHPILAAAKVHFPGATIEAVRPAKRDRDKLDDSLSGLPGIGLEDAV
jgi:hypothetical protein